MVTIPQIIQKKVNTFDEKEIQKLENIMISMLTSPILFIGSIITFIFRYLFYHEAIAIVLTDSFVLLLAAIFINLSVKLHISELRKEDLLNFLMVFILIYFKIRFFYLLETCVFVLGYVFIVISLVRERLKTTLTVAVVSLLMIQHAYFYSNITLEILAPFQIFAMHSMSLLIFTLISCIIHKIIIDQNKLMKLSEQKQRFTLQSVGDGIITVQQDGLIEYINPVAEEMTGWARVEAYGQEFDTVFRIINEFTKKPEISPLKEVFETGNIVQLENHTLLIKKDGEKISIEDTAAPIIDDRNNIIGAVIVFKDNSKIKMKQREIEYLSFHDQLTGLYNRRYFEEELQRLDTKRNLPLSIIYADVNGLKIINDAFGHEKGDWLLQNVANIMKSSCRADDIISRVGGDEFVILLPNMNEDSVASLVQRIREKSTCIIVNTIQLSISFGWDTKCVEHQSSLTILNNAEKQMYRKKILYNTSHRNDIIKSIHNALLIKVPQEEAHAERVCLFCEKLATALRRESEAIKELKLAAYLHDIGKIAVDENILHKPGQLSASERNQVEKHPEIGFRLLGSSSEFNDVAECILQHHERWDGSGYPNGLIGESICWNARVIGIADAYDAMTSDRPYRKAMSKDDAIIELKNNSGTQFDPDIIKVFIKIISENDICCNEKNKDIFSL